MIRPQFFDALPEPLLELYDAVVLDIIEDMARRISTYDYWIPAAEHQYQKLRLAGETEKRILRQLSQMTGKRESVLQQLIKDAAVEAWRNDAGIYKAAGLAVPTIRASEELQQIINAGYISTNGELANLTRTTAHTASGQFERALDRAWMQIQTGGFDYNTAVRRTIKDLSRQGVGAIRYPSGHTDTIEVAVRRAVVTGVNQTAGKLQWALADELECDLVETTAHAGARPSHTEWQGQVFSRSGKHPKYPNFVQATGYGTGAGLCGWNCRHSFNPYFEGMPRTYSSADLADYDAKKYSYNGQRMTEYEASQQQRRIERQIRRWKRENVAMSAAGMDTGESTAKIRSWQEVQKDFLRQTGLKRQGSREQIG